MTWREGVSLRCLTGGPEGGASAKAPQARACPPCLGVSKDSRVAEQCA